MNPVDRGSDPATPVAQKPEWLNSGGPGHIVQFYEDERSLLDTLAAFIGEGLLGGDRCLVVATHALRKALDERLQPHELDMDGIRACGDYLALDASETLSRFMVNGWPDEIRFTESLGQLVAQLTDGRRVRVFGEMVAVLCAEGNVAAAAPLEERWNELRRRHPFSLFCAYPLNAFHGVAHQDPFAGICKQHDHVMPAESYTHLASTEERLQRIAELQQKALSLEAEIATRTKLEQALRQKVQELHEKLTDLELFHDMAVNRELKMIELERENQALKCELARLKANGNTAISDAHAAQ